MIKRLALFAILLMMPLMMAPNIMQSVGGGASHPDITFWANAEANDTATPYTMAGSECSDGDTTGDLTNSAGSISSPAAAVGTYSFGLDGNAGARHIRFTTTDYDIFPRDTGGVAFWLYIDSVTENFGGEIFYLYADGGGAGETYLRADACNTDEICIDWKSDGGSPTTYASTTSPIENNAACTLSEDPFTCCSGPGTGTCDQWRFIEIWYTTSATGSTGQMTVNVDGVEVIDDATGIKEMNATITSTAYIQFGDNGSGLFETFIDNFMVSTSNGKDFYSIRNETSAPTGSCDG